jgi:AMMECR1 domain-containing protein
VFRVGYTWLAWVLTVIPAACCYCCKRNIAQFLSKRKENRKKQLENLFLGSFVQNKAQNTFFVALKQHSPAVRGCVVLMRFDLEAVAQANGQLRE